MKKKPTDAIVKAAAPKPKRTAKGPDPNTKDEAFEDVVKSAQDAAVLVLVY